jgi:glycogen debranching enzyme
MKPDTYHLDRRRCSDLDAGRTIEWLVTNGRGGFAMATVHQMLTRRYHGLLVTTAGRPNNCSLGQGRPGTCGLVDSEANNAPATSSLEERFVLLAKLEATVTVGDVAHELASNDFAPLADPGPETRPPASVVHPQGYRLLDSFSVRPYPTWRWRVGDTVIEQTLCMARGEATTFVRYRLLNGAGPVVLSVRPLCTSRRFHTLVLARDIAAPSTETKGRRVILRWPGNRPTCRIDHNGTFHAEPDWHYRFFLAEEVRRGYDAMQDLFTPGTITATLTPDDSSGLVIAASTLGRPWEDWEQAFSQAASRDRPTGHTLSLAVKDEPVADARPAITGDGPATGLPAADDPLLEHLIRATDAFLVSRDAESQTVVAGYPWFGDWGRDTFISLPGLCLVPGRIDDARRIIESFASLVDRGMIPNRFPDAGNAPAYNTVDATLWYIHALDRYLTYSGDWGLVAETMFPIIIDILEAHRRGTRHGIHVCEDGLLAAGEPGLALTWMDAQLPGRSVTPRIGKPVEINALWYNALQIAAGYADCLGAADHADRWRATAARARASFNQRFWNESTGCLFDVVAAGGHDATADGSIRPNQLLAISLTHPVLDEPRRQDVVSVCERELWTPMGLRTLSPSDPAYQGRYQGDQASRDGAYHQGTAWPWLLGPLVTAYVRAHGSTAPARRTARRFLDGLLAHLAEAGIGGISEVADGAPPHTPGGCPWQAWSIAEPLRALCEDIYATHPPAQPRHIPSPSSQPSAAC